MNQTAAWAQEYRAGASVRAIGQKHGVYGQLVWSRLKRAGIEMRSLEAAIRKEPIRLDAFSGELTRDDAYWLGLLYADGSISVAKKTGFDVLSLVAHSDDEESIVGFLAHLGLSGPLIRRKDKRAVSTAVTSKTISQRLRALGIVPSKTHSITFPQFLSQPLIRHFVRGYFDGDGSIYSKTPRRYVTPQFTVQFTGNPKFIAGLSDAVERETGLQKSSRYVKPGGRTVSHRYEGRLRLMKLSDWLYSDGGPFLSRKKSILAAVAGEIAERKAQGTLR